MRVRFVHIVRDTTVSYSHALASLAAVLAGERKTGLTLDLRTVRSAALSANVDRLIEDHPEVFLFTCMSNQWKYACELAAEIRIRDNSALLVVGGSHIQAAPSTVKTSPFNIAVVGEGENIIVDLVRQIANRNSLPSSCQLVDGPLIEDLDKLPLPLLSLFEVGDILAYPSVMFSRGCPYRCTYCMSRLGGLGGKIRWKSPRRAIAEVEQLVEWSNTREVYIDDDTFLKNQIWVREFCEAYSARISIPFFCNARPETVRQEVCEALVRAGCAAVGIGIESGSENIRREVLNRRMSDDTIMRAFDQVHDAGMKTWSFNMVGIPGETPEDLAKTIRLNDRVATDYVRVSIYTPYPGTPLYDESSDASYAKGYFRSPATLDSEMRKLYTRWLRRLENEGRLWFTKSEADLI